MSRRAYVLGFALCALRVVPDRRTRGWRAQPRIVVKVRCGLICKCAVVDAAPVSTATVHEHQTDRLSVRRRPV